MSKLTEEVRARLEKATKGLWRYCTSQPDFQYRTAEDGPLIHEDVPATVRCISENEAGLRTTSFVATCNATTLDNDANAELIAHAPADLAALVQQVEAAEKLALSLNEVMAMRQAVIDVGGAEGPLDLQVIAKFAEMQVGVTDRIVAALAHWEEVTKL